MMLIVGLVIIVVCANMVPSGGVVGDDGNGIGGDFRVVRDGVGNNNDDSGVTDNGSGVGDDCGYGNADDAGSRVDFVG